MFYETGLSYKNLNTRSDYFNEFLPIAKEIESLSKGGHALTPADYVLFRDNEPPNAMKKRIEKFAPENYFGAAIRLQRVHQKSGELEVKEESLPGDISIWEDFFTRVDKKNNSLKDFVIDVFSKALVTKMSYVQVELDYLLDTDTNLAIAEEILKERRPYYFHVPLQCIMSEEFDGNNLLWVKYKRIDVNDTPFTGTIYNMTFVLADDQHITYWTFENIKYDDEFNITQIWDQSLNYGKGGYRKIKPEEDFAIPLSIDHGRKACPVLKYEMDDSLWMSDQVYLAQKIIYGLSMNMIHTASFAGFIQKWIRPYIAGNDTRVSKESGGASYIPLPKEALSEIIKKYAESLGDESVIMADFFTFEEVKGDAVIMIQNLIDRLKNYIFTTILFNNARFESTKVDTQSGTAKEIDFHVQNLALKDHGSNIIEFTKNLLSHTARAMGHTDRVLLSTINVTGMNRFDVRPVQQILDVIERLFKIPTAVIPPDLLIEAMNQLSRLIIENTTYEYKNQLNTVIIDKINTYLDQTVIKDNSKFASVE